MEDIAADVQHHTLRPNQHAQVPAHIRRPDYADDGYPDSEVESRQQKSVVQRTPKELEGIRAACLLGRQILDQAHAAVKPGVTTDEIDRIVSAWPAAEHAV